MSYESSVNKLLELAGDYKTIISEHLLEDATYKVTYKELKLKLDTVVSSLSVGDCALALTCDDKIVVTDIKTGIRGDISVFSIHPLMISESYDQRFRDILYQLMMSTINKMSNRNKDITFSDISRFAGYANLVVSSINKENLSELRSTSKKRCDTIKAHEDEESRYNEYINLVATALGAVAWQWFREVELKPGMKIGVFSHDGYSTIVRTVKEATKDKDTLRISFEETCNVVTNITRIDYYTTWFMNAEECTDIARAIRWKYIVNYI